VLLARVHLHRRSDQVSDDHERAHANESCHADGEQKPDKLNSLGADAKAAHLFVCQTACICGRQCSATLPALKPSFYKLDRSADVFSWDPV
jgi:hypothetical protein